MGRGVTQPMSNSCTSFASRLAGSIFISCLLSFYLCYLFPLLCYAPNPAAFEPGLETEIVGSAFRFAAVA
jgi:hypothetical protein